MPTHEAGNATKSDGVETRFEVDHGLSNLGIRGDVIVAKAAREKTCALPPSGLNMRFSQEKVLDESRSADLFSHRIRERCLKNFLA